MIEYIDTNLLWKTKVYCMGAMQYQDGQQWRKLVKEILSPRGIIVFDPYHKPFIEEVSEDNQARATMAANMVLGHYDVVAARMKRVRSDDLRLCDLSDFGIVQVIPEVSTWGTPEEVSWFVRCKKPLFIFVEGGKAKCPVWILGQMPHKYIYDSLEDVLSMILKIDSGEVKADNSRWRLLRKEYR